jgi:hypothetical protein
MKPRLRQECKEYDRAIEWASWAGSMGTSAQSIAVVPESDEVAGYEKSPA